VRPWRGEKNALLLFIFSWTQEREIALITARRFWHSDFVMVHRFKVQGSRLEMGGLLGIWTIDAFALKGESMPMERFEDIEAWQPASEPTCKL